MRGLWDLLTVFPSQELEECNYESISLRDRILQTLYWLFGNRILQISSLNITWKIFPHQTRLHEHLNHFLEDPHEFGFRILHNESLTYNDTSSVLPWLYSIGDNIGLFPIAFADRFVSFLFWWLLIQRLERATLTDLWKSEEDLWVVQQVVERCYLCITFVLPIAILLVKYKVRNKLAHWGRITSEPRYIYGYPWHLPDGTISRWISWPAEGFLEPRALTGYCYCYCYHYCYCYCYCYMLLLFLWIEVGR